MIHSATSIIAKQALNSLGCSTYLIELDQDFGKNLSGLLAHEKYI